VQQNRKIKINGKGKGREELRSSLGLMPHGFNATRIRKKIKGAIIKKLNNHSVQKVA
jgi:hypothetical protein